ncbi:hypothetical protein BDW75DRAFT_230156 [Aspergillus navahoensis]
MLPSVAPFPPVQPHHHLNQYQEAESLNGPYGLDNPFATTHSPHDYTNSNSFQSAPRTRLQYPHPVQRPDIRDRTNSAALTLNNVGEHALRRKTPNGTLAAGYDGTPGDMTIQPPATKHILVSQLEPGQLISPQAGFPIDSWQQSSLDQSSAQPLNFPPMHKTDTNRRNVGPGELAQGINGISWIRSLNAAPGMDSVLNQTLPMQPSQQRFYWQNGAYVPTVLPATLQQCIGPTASAGTGPYGPYWPDGAYIPYRPAAFREPRLNPQGPFANLVNHSGPQFFDAGQQPFNAGLAPSSNLEASDWNQNSLSVSNRDGPVKNNFPPRHSDQKPFDSLNNQHVLPFHTRQSSSISGFPSRPLLHEAPASWSGTPGSGGFQCTGPLPNSRTANTEFKEKVLSWAHGVYVDLLASIHRARRNSASNIIQDGQTQRVMKPSIYPKPPRQPGLDFSHINAPEFSRHNSYPSSQAHRHDRNSTSQFQPTANHLVERLRHTGRLNSISGSPFSSNSLSENTTVVNAASSLELLSHLCMESGWEWIDGMLLGGCLAYGLGDYHKAMRWYSRIIARDAAHVEAISNLAATLLALDRREEALQHWLRAVKLRPSYFEAVEHLIGLLCSSQRGKEAVNIIDFVQNSLRLSKNGDCFKADEHASESESDAESRVSGASDVGSYEKATFDYDDDFGRSAVASRQSGEGVAGGFGSSGYSVPGCDNGRILALVHAKGNMLYAMGDYATAAAAFEDAILISAGRRRHGIQGIIKQIFAAFSQDSRGRYMGDRQDPQETILLYPDKALQTSKLVFAPCGTPPGIKYVPEGLARKAALSTTSNSLLSLAKIYQDGMSTAPATGPPRSAPGVRDILALYYLSLSLQPSPSTANNVGILLAGIHNNAPAKGTTRPGGEIQHPDIPGVIPGSGVSLALAYYNYGLQLDSRHAHLYTNLGSLLKDIGMLRDPYGIDTGSGWIKRVVDIVDRQLKEGETWGCGILTPNIIEQLCAQLLSGANGRRRSATGNVAALLKSWAGQKWEGSRVVKFVERVIRSITWQWYQDRYVYGREYPSSKYRRPQLPPGLSTPNAPTVLPFHTFTCPLSAKQIRQISQRNGLRISCAALRSSWLPSTVYPPPPPPNPYLKVGYVSSDFNNHPLAHLMQSVFGLHNPTKVKAYCYATTASDKSIHRQQIEKEAPVFYDASGWPVERLVKQIVDDGIHILINLNGYTRGARNEVFAARPAPIHMSFMGFAGTLGAEWCDYILADELSIPPETLSPGTRNTRIEDRHLEEDHGEEAENWIYGEKIVFTRDTFFCCDHRQSAPDARDSYITWEQEQSRRWRMRKELFPTVSDDTIILGNFNQLYKIEPTTFRTWLRILARIPNAVLWLLRFPDIGEQNLRETAVAWAGEETASRIIFTDVAPKNTHIARAKILDLFLDTPECNAHTTATDVLWSGTPLLTLPRYKYKMCSRMASSILSSALPKTESGQQAREELIAVSDEDYENKAIHLCRSLSYEPGGSGRARGRLFELRRMLFEGRQRSSLFDTSRWVRDLEDAYQRVWSQWVNGEEGDIWL